MKTNAQNSVMVKIRHLVEFFDEIPPDSVKHATSVIAVAGEDLGAGLLKHYLECIQKARVEILHDADSRPFKVTTGRQKGPRLDRWIAVTWPDGTATLFQTEIKNWSAHAIGGERLRIAADPVEMSERMRREWESRRDSLGGPLNPVNKVLVPMKAPPLANPSARLTPLLIYWVPLHPQGQEESFFWHILGPSDYPEGQERLFERLGIFSMSLYLRNLIGQREDMIELWMPDTARRLQWLRTLFPA